MSAVVGEPEVLAELSWRLRAQADEHAALRQALRRSLDVTPLHDGTTANLVAAAASSTQDIGELARSFDDLASFVREVGEALLAADATLAAVNDGWMGSGTSPWTTFSTGRGSVRTWSRGLGTRRTFAGERNGPFARAARSGTVTVGNGSVQERWKAKTDVSVIEVARSKQVFGKGGTHRIGGDLSHVDLHAHAGLLVAVAATAGVTNREAHLTVNGRVELGAAVSVTATAGNAALGVGTAARAFAGASAEGEATFRAGLDGVEAEFEGRALLGAEAEIEGELSVLGVVARPSAGVMVGVGAELTAEADIGLEKIGFAVDLGATLGIGVSVGIDISVNPRAVAGGVVDAVGGAGGAAKKGYKKVKGWFS